MIPLPGPFRTRPLAHRALHDRAAGRPENSRAAVRAAIAAGYGIEIDLQRSRDGCAMVFHDYDLGRLTAERGAVQQRTARELGDIPLLNGTEGIPTLAEILDLVAGRVPLLIELKDQHGQMGETDGALERAVARDAAGYAGPLALMSFNPHSVIRLRELLPGVPRGLTTCSFDAEHWPLLRERTRQRLRSVPDFAAAGAAFISHEAGDLHRPRVAQLKAGGAAVLCWTIRSPQAEAQAREVADNITFEGYRPAIPT